MVAITPTVPVPSNHIGKPHNSRDRGLKGVLLQLWELIRSRWTSALDLLNKSEKKESKQSVSPGITYMKQTKQTQKTRTKKQKVELIETVER